MITLCRYTIRHGHKVSSGSRKYCGLSLERRVERESAHACIQGYTTAFRSIQTTWGNPDSRWSLINVVDLITNPMQLTESRYDIVWVTKCMPKARIIRR